MIYALVKNGLVENLIVADAEFAALIAADWDAVVQVQDGTHCALGFGYIDGAFVEPAPIAVETIGA
jgi:hypothetical protein